MKAIRLKCTCQRFKDNNGNVFSKVRQLLFSVKSSVLSYGFHNDFHHFRGTHANNVTMQFTYCNYLCFKKLCAHTHFGVAGALH